MPKITRYIVQVRNPKGLWANPPALPDCKSYLRREDAERLAEAMTKCGCGWITRVTEL